LKAVALQRTDRRVQAEPCAALKRFLALSLQTSALVLFDDEAACKKALKTAGTSRVLQITPTEPEGHYGLRGWVEAHKARFPGNEVDRPDWLCNALPGAVLPNFAPRSAPAIPSPAGSNRLFLASAHTANPFLCRAGGSGFPCECTHRRLIFVPRFAQVGERRSRCAVLGKQVLQKELDDWTEEFEAAQERKRKAVEEAEDDGWTVVKRHRVRCPIPPSGSAVSQQRHRPRQAFGCPGPISRTGGQPRTDEASHQHHQPHQAFDRPGQIRISQNKSG
jgi:Ribosomal RNA-processing protein 7 (RRP7) C-terminal domain